MLGGLVCLCGLVCLALGGLVCLGLFCGLVRLGLCGLHCIVYEKGPVLPFVVAADQCIGLIGLALGH